jgi:hypothetical protein
VSDAAVAIIAHPSGAPERVEALKRAASRPELFSEIDKRFQGSKVSDQAIRSFLLTQKFIPTAADAAIRAYRETKQLVEAESEDYAPPDEAGAIEDAIVEQQTVVSSRQDRPVGGVPLPSSDPYRLTMFPDRLEVIANLKTLADADDLIRRLSAWKVLLMPIESDQRPQDEAATR